MRHQEKKFKRDLEMHCDYLKLAAGVLDSSPQSGPFKATKSRKRATQVAIGRPSRRVKLIKTTDFF